MENQGQCVPSPCPVEQEDPMALRGFVSVNVGPVRLEFGLNNLNHAQMLECLTTAANKALSIIEGLYSEIPKDEE